MTIAERPILFTAPMVRGILDGRKTQTRRIMKPVAPGNAGMCPYGQKGHRLWVRETWGVAPAWEDAFNASLHGRELPGVLVARPASKWADCIIYKADGGLFSDGQKWRPSIHMPRWASRITLEILCVHVERLRDITEDDAMAEGALRCVMDDDGKFYESEKGTYKCGFAINGAGSWDANPWVWAISFRRIDKENGK